MTALPAVIVPRPRCPRCGSLDLATRTSRALKGGDRVRYERCRECGARFKVYERARRRVVTDNEGR